MIPSPEQASQRPPLTLKLKRPFYSPEFWLHWSEQRDHEYHRRRLYRSLDWNESPTNRALINVDQAIDMLNPLNRLVFPWFSELRLSF